MPVRPRFYYFTILLCYYATNLRIYEFYAKSGVCISKTYLCRLDSEFTTLLIARKIQKKKTPPSLFTFNRVSSTASAVCISKTHLCRFDPDFTLLLCLLFYFCTNLVILREIGSLHLERKPICAGSTQILLFYYFTNLLILREIGSLHLENPPVPVGPRIYHLHLENLLWHVGSLESLHLENLPWHVGPPICMSDRGIPCSLAASQKPASGNNPNPHDQDG